VIYEAAVINPDGTVYPPQAAATYGLPGSPYLYLGAQQAQPPSYWASPTTVLWNQGLPQVEPVWDPLTEQWLWPGIQVFRDRQMVDLGGVWPGTNIPRVRLDFVGDYGFVEDNRTGPDAIQPNPDVTLTPTPAPAATEPGPTPTPLPQIPQTGSIYPQPSPTPVAPGPLAAPSLPGYACSGAPYADVCGAARSGAAQLVNGLTLPTTPLTVHHNPNVGVTRLSTWFWVEGYAGEPITATTDISVPWVHRWTDELGIEQEESGTYHVSVFVRVRPARYVWDFGDSSRLDTASLGQAYPAESDVQHTFLWHSHGQAGGRYTYGLGIDWVSDWRASGDASGQGPGPSRSTVYQDSVQVDDVLQLRCPDTGCRN
jgi:hypothetical protein